MTSTAADVKQPDTATTIPAVQYPQVPAPSGSTTVSDKSMMAGQTDEMQPQTHTHISTPAPVLPPRHHAADAEHEQSKLPLHTEQHQFADANAEAGPAAAVAGAGAGQGAPLPPPHHGGAHAHGGIHSEGNHGLHEHEAAHPTGAGSSSPGRYASGTAAGGHAGAGDKLGGSIKSGYNVVHGGMEILRGTMLGLGDAAGDLVASRRHGHGEGEPAAPRTQSSADITARGREELNRGMGSFRK